MEEEQSIKIVDDPATENWNWFQYTEARGHRDYCAEAVKCERFYLGKGKQWDDEVKAELNGAGKPTYEINEIKTAVNVAAAYQINNRMDAVLYPRGGEADDDQAEIKGKVLRQQMDSQNYKWRETEVFMDGMIQQRGYFDVSVKFDENLNGSLEIDVLDPLDVRPDPDSKSYDPDDWGFVIITRWMPLSWVEENYGRKLRLEVENSYDDSNDWGDTTQERRSSFGDANGSMASCTINGIKRVRIIDRQFFSFEMTAVLISPEGDILPEDGFQRDAVEQSLQEGFIRVKRMMRRVKRVVSTSKTTLFNNYAPIDHYTPVPFFPVFRRGQTSGMVDDAISPQEMLNKAISQYQHIINTTANSGYFVEEGSLVDPIEDLEENGSKTGVIIKYKQGSQAPQKIQPNQVPSGVDHFIDRALMGIRDVTGINESMLDPGKNQSGVAIQAQQFIAQQQLAVPLDNMARTRHMVHIRALKIIQKYMTGEQVLRIAEKDMFGKDIYTPLKINERREDGSISNDMTSGTYDIVITDKPMTVTWENSEFEQAMEMRKNGVAIPDWVPVKHSNLADKGELLKTMQESKPDPLAEAQTRKENALADKYGAEAISKGVESMYSSTTAANLIAATPSIAPLADAMMKSAGFQDKDAGGIVPEPNAPVDPIPMDENTHPLSPPNPDVGMTATPQQGIGRAA